MRVDVEIGQRPGQDQEAHQIQHGQRVQPAAPGRPVDAGAFGHSLRGRLVASAGSGTGSSVISAPVRGPGLALLTHGPGARARGRAHPRPVARSRRHPPPRASAPAHSGSKRTKARAVSADRNMAERSVCARSAAAAAAGKSGRRTPSRRRSCVMHAGNREVSAFRSARRPGRAHAPPGCGPRAGHCARASSASAAASPSASSTLANPASRARAAVARPTARIGTVPIPVRQRRDGVPAGQQDGVELASGRSRWPWRTCSTGPMTGSNPSAATRRGRLRGVGLRPGDQDLPPSAFRQRCRAGYRRAARSPARCRSARRPPPGHAGCA